MKEFFKKIKTWLQGLSFRTGVIVLLSCLKNIGIPKSRNPIVRYIDPNA